MSEKKTLCIEELEKICGGVDNNFMGLTAEEMEEFNEILAECHEAVVAKDRDKFLKLISKAHAFDDAHPDAHDYVSNVINILQEVWRKVDVWF